MVRLHRVTLPVPDVEEAAHFYSGLLGFPGERVAPGWHYFRCGDGILALHEYEGDTGDPMPHGAPVFLAIDEPIVHAVAKARMLGARNIDAEVRTLGHGERGARFTDPFGNVICLIEAATAAWGGPDVGSGTIHGESTELSLQREFLNAVKGGEAARVKELLTLDATLVDATDSTGVSALLLAAYKRKPRVAQILLALRGSFTVWEAAAFGMADRLRLQLEQTPEQVNTHSVDGFTPLGLACFFGHPDSVVVLLEKGADPNLPARNAMRVHPLHSAMSHDNPGVAIRIASMLLLAGANMRASQQGGYTAMHQAADRGSKELVNFLLDARADPMARADNGRTPADIARAKGHHEIASLLGATSFVSI